MTPLEKITKSCLKTDLTDIQTGDTVKIYQKIPTYADAKAGKGKKEKAKGEFRTQVFEGVIIAKKHGKGISGTFTVRKIIDGVGVEKIFPLHSPLVEKIEIVSRAKVRRAKLYYLRERAGKSAKLKRKVFVPETKTEEVVS